MRTALTLEDTGSATSHSEPCRLTKLRHALDHAAHLLPRQGPIGVFIHHNTLHAFEHLPFEKAVVEASHWFGAEPYMAEAAYRAALARGRIQMEDIDAMLDREPNLAVIPGLSRHALRRAMMSPGVREFDAATTLWRTEQGDLAGDFERSELRTLFDVCLARTAAEEEKPRAPRPVDEIIHPWLIRVCSAFLDQGMTYWPMPHRKNGFYECTRELLALRGGLFPLYLTGLDEEFRRQSSLALSAAGAVLDYLDAGDFAEAEWDDVVRTELLALPGWAGLMRSIEQDPSLAPRAAFPCSLMDYLAVRLTMARVAVRAGAAATAPQENPLKTAEKRRLSRAARIYDAARVAPLSAEDLARLSAGDFAALVREVKACNGVERRRLFHLAYERRHERDFLHGLASHRRHSGIYKPGARPAAQIFFCIDEREESMRRALEELDPEVETFSTAGYFEVAIDYKGIDDAHGAAFCPIVLKPRHAIREQPHAEDHELLEMRRMRRRFLGLLMRHSFDSPRTLLRGWLSTAALGLLSAIPLAGHLLAPRGYARLRKALNKAFLPEPRTELALMRDTQQSQEAMAGLLIGFAVQEKTERVANVLRPAGLTQGFARLVILLGHGSTSLNNPHESAHDCGACGGRRGGPNARLFAAMANRTEVRHRLRQRGIDIPDDTWFIGGYHDTCSDEVELYDLDALPATHHPDLKRMRESLDKARADNARERARRFESCPHHASPGQALRHVEERSEHLAEPRPEYGHCTNAVCIVGRRGLTRGLFLDRRAFLTSYDAAQDPHNENLEAVLASGVPVCAGISLEYYFSFVDNDRYGCGTKLPHNVTGLVGVMDGHASDLRTGLPWQMVEIHEPMRILFVIETTPDRLAKAIDASPSLKRLVENRWIRMATIDPESGQVDVRREHGFETLDGSVPGLPVVSSSAEWYRGKIEHLAMASIQPGGTRGRGGKR
jgi:hypothetical protein